VKLTLFPNKQELGKQAALHAAETIRAAVAQRGRCRLLAATGGSQFEFLAALTALPNVPWEQVEMFHLDEYVGIGADHPASFRRYLRERLIGPTALRRYHLIEGDKDPRRVCRELGALLRAEPVDVAFAGIGENCHLAFNDPPADFATEEAYLIVDLDEACRRQQVGEGWFPSLADVPRQAISISIRQLLSAKTLIIPVPDARKAPAVRRCWLEPISPLVPASILRRHSDATVYLDSDSAALLPDDIRAPAV